MKRLRSAVHSLKLMPFGNSGAACPEGTYENSQAFQRRDSGRAPPSPEGTTELPRRFASIQPSRRDLNALDHVPGVETPGYCRQSLRDNTAARIQGNFRKALALTGIFPSAAKLQPGFFQEKRRLRERGTVRIARQRDGLTPLFPLKISAD